MKTLLRRSIVCLAPAILVLAASSAKADYALTIVNQGSSPFTGVWNLGFEFTANANLTVERLGYFDWDQDGLSTTREVGLWDLNGNLLTSAAVAPNDPLVGGFRYSAITPYNLISGQTYILASANHDTDPAIRSDQGSVDIVHPDITILNARWESGGGLTFPVNAPAGFYYQTASMDFGRTIPEPGALGVCGVMGAVAMFIRRRRR